jgi:hypothetical protein
VRCAGIKRGGERCKLEATHGSFCWSHAPETAEDRKHRAGRAGGNGRSAGISAASKEIATLKGRLTTLAARVLDRSIDRGDAVAVNQILNTILRAVEVERKILETDDLERRIEVLEQRQTTTQGGARSWR